MNNATELPITSVIRPYSSEVILSGINTHFIEDLVNTTFPDRMWENLQFIAEDKGLGPFDITQHKQSITRKISTLVSTFEQNARALKEQGHAITGFTLKIEVRNRSSREKITIEITTTAKGRTIHTEREAFTDDEWFIQEDITSFRLENIPWIIEEIRHDRRPVDLPQNLVNWIQSRLKENPEWTGNDIAQLKTFCLKMNLYELTMKPCLFYQSALKQLSTPSEQADVDASEITRIVPQTTVEKATPPFQKFTSTQTVVSNISIFRDHVQCINKPIQSNPAAIEETGLSSLSMTPSHSDV